MELHPKTRVEAYRLMEPVEQVGAWLFSVARNRITDLFRKKKPEVLTSDPMVIAEDGEVLLLEDMLPLWLRQLLQKEADLARC